MFYVYGSRLMGRVDRVPGVFHVATRFGHLNYIPLIPMKTFVVLASDGKKFRGVEVPFSFKSLIAAWGRFISGAALAASLLFMIILLSEGDANWWALIILAVISGGIFAMFMSLPFFTRASHARACALAWRIGMSEEAVAKVSAIYGKPPIPPPQGFTPIVQARAAAPAAPPAIPVARKMPKPPTFDPIPLEPENSFPSNAPAPRQDDEPGIGL